MKIGHVAAVALVAAVSASAQTVPVINEFVANHTGTDTNEFVEVKGNASTDYSAYSILHIEGDGTGAGVIDTVWTIGTTGASGYWTTGYLNSAIENGTITLLLVRNFSGAAGNDLDTNNDGTLDSTPWDLLVDSVAVHDGGADDDYYSTTVLNAVFGGGLTPGGASRIPDATDTDTTADWLLNDFDGAGIPALDPGTPVVGEAYNTPGAVNAAVTALAADPKINEFVASHAGTDDHEFVEIVGDASTDYSDFWLVQIEGDAGVVGIVDAFWQIGTTDANGYWTTGYLTNVFENGTLTILLVEAFTGSVGADLDTNDDGAIDVMPWDLIVDSVGVHDGGAGDFVFSTTVLNAAFDGGAFTPGGASRVPNGTDTDTAADWMRNDFDLAGISGYAGTPVVGEAYNTPAAENAAVPEPVADLVINEIDYDQVGTDAAEFIEIRNNGSTAVNLDAYSIELVNGTGGGASVYSTVDLPNVSLAAGDYYVVCANAGTVPNCDLDASPDTDFIQNGAPDAVALRNGTTLVDTVSYEGDTGAPYTEGTGTSAADSNGVAYVGLSRFADGTDTDVNNADFSLRCITPGTANSSAASGCTDPGAFLAVRINEVDSDTPGTDAAEFVELFDGGVGNTPLDGLVVVFFNGSNDLSYAAYDLDGYSTDASGYFLLGNAALDEDIQFADNFLQNGADAVALYRANAADFPANTEVKTANLQDAIVYDTSDADDAGLLVLLTGGGQVNEDANSLGASQSSQRCPNGSGGMRNTAAYIQTAPTANASNFCVSGTYEIWQIQGNGLASPYDGTVVATNNNIVTAVGPQGFFIQTPDGRSDADVETSNGIYVYTNSAPPAGVIVGAQVDVAGLLDEFYDFTEFTGGPVVTVDSSGNTLPAVVTFDAALPSPDQPQAATAYERYEGMRVSIASGVVGGPSQYFGSDPTAEAYIVATTARPYREPGALYPGLGGTIPVWDGNPEVFELDSDKFAEAVDPINAGSTFSAEGVLAYEFEGYELWATSVTVNQATLPVPVRPRAAGEFAVGSFNVLRLFDDVNDPEIDDPTGEDVVSNAEYTRHLRKLSQYVREVLDSPDVLGVQEVENLGALQALATQIHSDDNALTYTAYLEEGNDVGGIDVGFLIRNTMAVDAVTQIGKDEIFTYDDSLLNDRPPLLFEGSYVGNGVPFAVKVLVIHNRSLSSIESSDRVRQKRLAQAQSVATIVQNLQTADPGVRLLVVGDFNAYEDTDGYVDVTGQIKGDVVPAENLLSGPDLVDPNLVDEVLNLPPQEHYSFIFDGTAQVLDHALWAQGLATFQRGMEYGRGNADAPEMLELDDTTPLRCSDHDGLVFYVMSDADGDGYPDDAPQFETTSNDGGTATGDVTDDSGIVSVVLLAGSSNVTLQITGNPGDTSWGWSVSLIDAGAGGTAVLEATDADGRVSVYVVVLSVATPIPVASPAGLALLAVLLAAAAAVALRRS